MKLETVFVGLLLLIFGTYIVLHNQNVKTYNLFYEGGHDDLCAQILEVPGQSKCEEKQVRRSRMVKGISGFPSSISYLDLETKCEVLINGKPTIVDSDEYPEIDIPKISNRRVCLKFK